jgi:hypothetical protein
MSMIGKFVLVVLCMVMSLPALSATGLVGYWPMDEGAGTVIDECSGAGLASEAVVLGLSAWTDSARGSALAFANNGTVRIDNSPVLDVGDGPLTFSLWVKLEKGAGGAIFEHYFGGLPGRWGLIAQGAPILAIYDDNRQHQRLEFPTFQHGVWQHLTVVWQRGKNGWVKGYVNGELRQEKTGITATVRHAEDLYVGSIQNNHQFLNGGSVRELAFFNRTLTDAEVATLYTDGPPLGAPVVVSSLKTNKILYRPNEEGTVTVRIKNVTATEQAVELSLALVSGVAQSRVLAQQPLVLPAKGTKVVALPMRMAGERYGCEVRASLTQQGKALTSKREFFSVAENFFDVGIGSDWGGGLHTANDQYTVVPDRARKIYSNYFEIFFWSPCDWALHVAPQKRWWSGQSSYPEDEDNLQDLIKKSHEQGIRVAFYANSNPAGPFGWEAARRHPDWFGGGGFGRTSHYNPEALDHWNDVEWRKNVKGNPGWYVMKPDLRREDALHFGIDRIIDSAKHYNWDAVRFDGHYTILNSDALSTRNMRRLKERVWKEVPGFGFGYNYGRAPEWLGVTHELREAMAGGGMYLQEGIRNWRYTNDQYQSWQHYITNELRIAKMIYGMGGSYHCMWSDTRLTPAQAYYKLVYGLIAGGHPADSGIYTAAPGCTSWGAFMTRWSELLWHPGLRAAPAAAEQFTVANPDVQWKELLQECVLSPTRKRVVLHLVNPSDSDEIAKSAFRDPVGPFQVTYRPAAGTKLISTTLVRPDALPYDTALQGATVTVPGLSHWAMLVYEVEGQFTMPATPPTFTEQPDPEKLKWSPDEALMTRTDPNKEDDVSESAGPNDIIVSLATGGVNIGRVTTIDPASPQGSVQWRDPAKTSGNIGKFWTGPYAPGRYTFIIRLKWADPNADITPQQLTMRVTAEKGEVLQDTFTFVTPGHPKAPANAVTLGEKGVYQTYALGGVEIKKPEYFTFQGMASTDAAGAHTLYAEKIVVTLEERYTDTQLALWNEIAKPAGLRAPTGNKPAKVLLVKGLFSAFYGVETAVPCDAVYALPKTYEELYAYDAVVLCNLDMRTSTFAARRMFQDFVEDGGRLVLLGGNRTLGEGGMKGTYFDDLAPFAIAGDGEVTACQPPARLGAKAGQPYAEKPALFWQHKLAVKPDAFTLAYAGKDPVAARLRSGKGETVLFTGTVLGEAAPGETPFWQCASWRTLLTRLIRE